MATKQLTNQKKQLENLLRQYGVEGEDAFYVLAYRCVAHSNVAIEEFPAQNVKRGSRIFDKVKHDKGTVKLVDSLVSPDVAPENLPILYQYFLGRRFREGTGKFFTPHSIASAMAALLPCREGAVIMDPTCGGGTFLLEASKRWVGLSCHIVANDIETSLVDLAQIVLALGTSRKHKKSFMNENIFESNSLMQEWHGKVDYILANPPFSLQVETLKAKSKLYDLGYRNSDALFLDMCFRLLREGGRLVCLLPHSVIANTEFQKLRTVIEESWNLLGVIGMPEGVFHLTADTTTRASIVILEKRSSDLPFASKVVFAFAPSVGIPLNRRTGNHEKNYLDEIVKHQDLMKVLGISEVECD